MYLYKYHNEPKTLYNYSEAVKKVVPELALDELAYSIDIDYDSIMNDPETAFDVALNVIGGRFPEGEKAMKDEGFHSDYLNFLDYIKKGIKIV